MASKITKKELKYLPVTAYQDLRKSLKSGDLLFASGNYFVSKAIRKVTDSPWSHVGIVFNIEQIDRILLLESVEDVGVRFAPLSKYIENYEKGKPYKGEVAIARVSDVDSDLVNDLAKHGVDELTMPYDKGEIAKIISRIALKQGKWKRDREYICSELVYECFEKSGKVFKFDKRSFISPENIWCDDSVKMLSRVL